MTAYGLGDVGATLAARLLDFIGVEYILTNVLITPTHHLVFRLPDTGFFIQPIDLWLPGAPLHFPYGQHVPADVPL